MSKRQDTDYLLDIKEASTRILDYVGFSRDSFYQDSKTQDAVVRNLEIIGEATKNISSEITDKYTTIQWSEIARMRDKLIHHYFGVNLDIVWDIIEDSIPELLKQVNIILSDLDIDQ